MNYDILNMTLSFACGAMATAILFIVLRKKQTPTKTVALVCPRCNSKKVQREKDTYWCTKCGKEWAAFEAGEKEELKNIGIELPEPIVNTFICKYCEKEFENESKLRRHIGMGHSDKIQI